jgi:hypothetical protein
LLRQLVVGATQEGWMKTLLAFICLFSAMPAFAQRTYVIENWPDDIEKLP